MGLLDSIKSKLQSSGGSGGGKIDVGGRFARQRTAATGTMAHFFVAKDNKHNDRIVGVKILDIEKMELFEARFKGQGKPSEGEIAMSMKHPMEPSWRLGPMIATVLTMSTPSASMPMARSEDRTVVVQI